MASKRILTGPNSVDARQTVGSSSAMAASSVTLSLLSSRSVSVSENPDLPVDTVSNSSNQILTSHNSIGACASHAVDSFADVMEVAPFGTFVPLETTARVVSPHWLCRSPSASGHCEFSPPCRWCAILLTLKRAIFR
ncbi:hypothetical protein C8J56DRAFT_1035969 [Mycena floridula]|nr:hypothetical protein C8J56DRAFT_1035969 [Mycena floridula]